MGRKRRKFTPEFKREVVDLCAKGDRSVGQVCRDLDLGETAVRRWIKQHEVGSGATASGALTTKEREELRRLRRENKRLREDRAISKKGRSLLCARERVKFNFIHAEKANHGIAALCRVMQVSRSGYYKWRHREPSLRQQLDHVLAVHIRAAHTANRETYGSPRVHAELRRQGFRVGRKRVARLMRANALRGNRPRRFKQTTDSEHGRAVAPNHLLQNFECGEPDRVWVADITYVRTWEGWLYLAVVIDLFSRRVVGWAADSHMRVELALEALQMGLSRRAPPPHLIHHSDRGSQYAAKAYVDALADHDAIASMSERGDCYDNAVAESFFGTLKTELVHRAVWPTRDKARRAIRDYIEHFYNPVRMHTKLGFKSPAEFERAYKAQAALAA